MIRVRAVSSPASYTLDRERFDDSAPRGTAPPAVGRRTRDRMAGALRRCVEAARGVRRGVEGGTPEAAGTSGEAAGWASRRQALDAGSAVPFLLSPGSSVVHVYT